MIWLIGAGDMAVDYVKVLQAQKAGFFIICRGEESAERIRTKIDIRDIFTGGLNTFLFLRRYIPEAAIVSVGIEELYDVARTLLEYGVKRILLEKPGGAAGGLRLEC